MWTIAAKNLWRRPFRTVLTVFGIAIAVSAVVALVGVSQALESSFLDLYLRRGGDLVVQPRGGAVELNKGVRVEVGDKIRKLPGVREVIGSLMDMVTFEDQDLFMVLVNGWETDSPVLQKVNLLTGRRLQTGDRRAVMLGRIIAANLGKKVGDSIQIYGQDFEVVGVFESFSVYENGAIFLLLDELQRQMDRPGEVTGFIVHAKDKSESGVALLRQEIESLDSTIAATPCTDFVGSLMQIKVARAMSWVTSLIAIILGTVGVMNTMMMSVFERRGEIASLRAMGWRKASVARLIVSESFSMSILGAVLGVTLGIGITVALTLWSKTAGLVQGDISARAIAEGIFVALAVGLIGAAYPIIRCSRLPIAETLRAS
jgi:putative ABC transport system permease protein